MSTSAVAASARSTGVLDAYVRSRLARITGQRFGFVIAMLCASTLAVMMMYVRAKDGPDLAFLPGVVARGASLSLLLLALPLGLAVAARGRSGPLDDASAVLPRLRGFDARDVAARAPRLVTAFAAARTALPVALLAAFSVLLSLPSLKTLALRAAVGALLVLIAAAGAAALALVGLVAARYARGWGRMLFVLALLAPSMLPSIVNGYPEAATPFGAYNAAVEAALALAP